MSANLQVQSVKNVKPITFTVVGRNIQSNKEADKRFIVYFPSDGK